MSASRNSSSGSANSWVSSIATRPISAPTNSSGTTSSNHHEKRVIVSGTYSGNISIPYNHEAEAKRRANLNANGVLAPLPKTGEIKI